MLASLLVVVALCCLGAQGNEGEIAFFKTPLQVHLSYTNDPTTMAVMWYTKDGTDLSAGVWYGLMPSNLTTMSKASENALSDGSGFSYTAEMTGLEAGGIYYYYVGSQKEFFSDIFSFRVPRSSDPVKILAFGDMGTHPRGDTTLMHGIRAREIHPEDPLKNPSVVLQAGDLMYPFGNQGMINAWFDAMQKVGSRVPFMVAPGNRDQQDLITERFNMPTSSFGLEHPEPQRHNFYYSFDVNIVHFIVMSTNFDSFRSTSAQYNWLKKDLEEAQERIADSNSPLSWIVLMGHTPIYSSSDGHTQGNHELKMEIEDLLSPVTLCLWGDDHVYERSHPVFKSLPDVLTDIHSINSNPGKPIHITVGTGGIDNDGWALEKPEWSAVRFITKGYLTITAKPTQFAVTFTDRDTGEIMDHFNIYSSSGIFSHPFLLLSGLLLVAAAVAFFWRGKKTKSSLGV